MVVGYEDVGYTISEVEDSVEVCVTSSSPGIAESFTINVTTNNTININSEFHHLNPYQRLRAYIYSKHSLLLFFYLSSDTSSFIQQSLNSLEFSVNDTQPSQRECYNISANVGAGGDICELSNCSSIIPFGINLELVDDAARVHLRRSSSLVVVELPSKCRCADESPSPTSRSFSSQTNTAIIVAATQNNTAIIIAAIQNNTAIIVAAIVPSLVVMLAIMAIIVVIVLFYVNKKRLRKVNLEE